MEINDNTNKKHMPITSYIKQLAVKGLSSI